MKQGFDPWSTSAGKWEQSYKNSDDFINSGVSPDTLHAGGSLPMWWRRRALPTLWVEEMF